MLHRVPGGGTPEARPAYSYQVFAPLARPPFPPKIFFLQAPAGVGAGVAFALLAAC